MGSNRSGSASDEEIKKYLPNQEEKVFVPAPKCCIYRVPKKLREINSYAYTPHLISIGPFHHKNGALSDMQKQKKRYRQEFVERIGKEKFEKLVIFVKDNEQGIRNCYAEELLIEEFIEMVLDDAVFIIQLFLRNHYRDGYEDDFLLHQLWLTKAIELDLQLLENQLPYFVLKKLYLLAFPKPTGITYPSFISLCCEFFGYDMHAGNLIEEKFEHFLDMRRCAMVKFRPKTEQSDQGTIRGRSIEEGNIKGGSTEEGAIEDLPCAVLLDEAGVRFKPAHTSQYDKRSLRLLDIRFEKVKGCIPLYKRSELQIPRIVIEDCSECLMRNLMALEQCCYPLETHICNYVALIDSLINTKKDVDLLFEKRIISNRVGDHTAISEMFNKLCLQITRSESCYRKLIKDLNAYHERWWNRTKATLMSVYFRDIWRGTATAAATIILLLAVLQTLQRLWGGWTPPSK